MGSKMIAQNLLLRAVAGCGGEMKEAVFCLSSSFSSLSLAAGADIPPLPPTPTPPNVVKGRTPIPKQRRQSPMPFPSPLPWRPSPEDLNLSARRYRDHRRPLASGGKWPSTLDPRIQSLAEYAVQEYNRRKKDTQFQLVKVLEAHAAFVAGVRFWITMEVADASSVLHKFNAEVWERAWMKPNPRQLLSWCRVKPVSENFD